MATIDSPSCRNGHSIFKLSQYHGFERRQGNLAPILAWLASVFLSICPLLVAAELPVVLRNNGAVVQFQGANLPGTPYNNSFGGQTLQIDQFDDRAVLHWESFNVSENNEVLFNQPRPSSIALNRILGPDASIINGRITANGRVFIINHDGIIFGENAVVNTRSFLASTLNIDDDVFLNVGFENAINSGQGSDGVPAFFRDAGIDRDMGGITIEAGAIIRSAENGRVLIFAPDVTNAGAIESPQGQVVLAGVEDEVYIAAADEDDDLRGLIVGLSTGGDVTNLGSVIAERGNVSMLGLAVNQEGLARATTSVSLDGSVYLMAQDMSGSASIEGPEDGKVPIPTRGGTLELGAGSVTEVVPDISDAVAPDSQVQNASVVNLDGETIHIKRDARVTATGGDISVVANSSPATPVSNIVRDPAAATAEIVIESGAIIDASGDDETEVSVARNFVEVEARGNELADAPVQRDGPIRNKTLTVDIRQGSDFLNTEGAAASIERDIHERLSPGGTIELATTGRIRVEQDAVLDVSGGQVAYTGDTVASSKLVTTDGKVLDIAEADPDLLYSGLLGEFEFKHEKWGITEVFRSALGGFEPGYVEGRDAGSVTLSSPGVTFDGRLLANTTAGIHQRRAPENLGNQQFAALGRPFDQLPLGGRLNITQLNINLVDLIIGADDGAVAYDNGHPVSTSAPLVLAPDIFVDSGLSRVTINNAGRIIVNRPLELAPYTELDLGGTQVLMQSDISTPGGGVVLDAAIPSGLGDIITDSGVALVKVDGDIDVSGRWTNDSVAVNASIASDTIVTRGGSIEILSRGGVLMAADSILDVSGGAYLEAGGKFTGGKGGDIVLRSGSTLGQAEFKGLDIKGKLRGFGLDSGGSLTFSTDAVLVAAPAATKDAQDFRLDSGRQFTLIPGSDGEGQIFRVAADTFQLGGFNSFELNALGRLEVAPGTSINLRAASPVLDAVAVQSLSPVTAVNLDANGHPLELVPTGTDLDSITRIEMLPAYQRSPVDLGLASGISPLEIGTAAVIEADPAAHIRLSGRSGVFIDGTIRAPAGKIDVLLAGNSAGQKQTVQSIQSRIWLGPNSRLLAPGAEKIDPVNNLGLRIGEVLDAGQVNIAAEYGSVLGARSAEINVDAVSSRLDLQNNGIRTSREVGGAAGEINFTAAESFAYSGKLSAQSVLDQPGGRLSFNLDPTNRGAEAPDTAPNAINLFYHGEFTAVMDDYSGTLPGTAGTVGPDLLGHAYIPVSQVASGGFDALDVRVRDSRPTAGSVSPDTTDSLPVVEFTRDTTLQLDRRLTLDAAVIRIDGDHDVMLDAPYIALGSTNNRPLEGSIPETREESPGIYIDNTAVLTLTPTSGPGSLRVEADLVELVGEMVTQGIGNPGERLQPDGRLAGPAGIELVAHQDIRMRGTRRDGETSTRFDGLFRTAGDVSLRAGRLYPVTLTDFEFSVIGAAGSIDYASPTETQPQNPLSAGGALALQADYIIQGGNLFAPLGTLELRSDSGLQLTSESLTSSSALGVAAPFFVTQPGGDLVLPNTGIGNNDIIFAESPSRPFQRELPEQRVSLQSPDIDVQQGARFDLRGDTDIGATEFIPGPGGSRDILLADLDPGAGIDVNDSFAIIPGLNAYAPFDPYETPQAESVQGIAIGDTLILDEGVEGLPSGEYAILPARYALFGGYLVTPVSGSQDLATGSNIRFSDNSYVLSGRYGVAGNDVASSRSQGFAVANGDIVRSRAEYLETPLDGFYSDGELRLPEDAGTLSIEAENRLQLAGELVQNGITDGRGSQVNIIADVIAIRETATGAGIELEAARLEQLGSDSLLIGARRNATADGLVIESVASEITVAAGLGIDVPELIMVADAIDVQSSSSEPTRLASTQASNAESERLIIAGDPALGINGDAAVVAVSNRTLTLERAAPTGNDTGELVLSGDAGLQAGGSVVADVAGNILFTGVIEAEGALVSLGATSVSLGETDGAGIESGLVMSNETLTGFAGSRLRLRSANGINVYGQLVNTDTDSELVFDDLSLDGQGLFGIANDNDRVALVANSIRLSNTTGSTAADFGATTNGSELVVSGGRIVLTDGLFKLQGYEDVNIVSASPVLLSGEGTLLSEASLSISAPVITGAAGADYTIAARDSKLTLRGADVAAALPAETGLAASLLLQGASVEFAGRVVLPSGQLRLHQVGDIDDPVAGRLELAPGAVLDVAGITQVYGPESIATAGGSIHLQADTGGIAVANGSLLNVSAGSENLDAGQIGIRLDSRAMEADETPLAVLEMSSGAILQSGSRGGRFSLDSHSLVVDGDNSGLAYSALSRLLGEGFSDRRSIRLRGQAIEHDAALSVRAHDVRLVSDSESIVVRGTIDASGQGIATVRENGGIIMMAAGDSINIESGAVLRARATPDTSGNPATGIKGGEVELIALDADGDDPGSELDRVNLMSGSLIDVSGGENRVFAADDFLVAAEQQLDGKVRVHTRLLDASSGSFVAGNLDAVITGAAVNDLVVTNRIEDSSIDATDIGDMRLQTQTFMANAPADVDGFRVTPGLLIESSGNLEINDEWDFFANAPSNWHFGADSVTGTLTLRAAGDITVSANLTDSYFDRPGLPPISPDLVDRLDTAATGAWSYKLAAGSDLASADLTSVRSGLGDVNLAPDVKIRTGTGDIEVVAGRDIDINTGAIYSGGRDRFLSQSMQDALSPPTTGLFDSDEIRVNRWLGGGAVFPVDGGNVTIIAGGLIEAGALPVTPTEWQPRVGSPVSIDDQTMIYSDAFSGAIPMHWGIAFERFSGIGALGGGELDVQAGGDLKNATLAIPTTGREIAGAQTVGNDVFVEALETTEVAGGGRLRVQVGGDAQNSQFYLGDGAADVQIGGSSFGTEIYTGFDARFRLTANDGVVLASVSDTGQIALSDSQGSLAGRDASFYTNAFYSYAETNRLGLQALAGNVDLVEALTTGSLRLPPSFSAISHSADLNINGSLVQHPSAQGQLDLIAGRSILGVSATRITQLDQDPALLESIQFPLTGFFNASVHAETPVHINDPQPNLIVAGQGDIRANLVDEPWGIDLAKSTHMQAGRDIENLNMKVQNNRADDISSVIAGRDIVQLVQRTDNGTFVTFRNENPLNASQFEISGPGLVEFLAGRDINLGTSDGIETAGNTLNRFLSDDGADLVMMAGLGGDIDTASFVQSYFIDGVEAIDIETGETRQVNYQPQLLEYLSERNIAVDEGDAVGVFLSLDSREQRPLLIDTLFSELKESGVYAQESGTSDYSRGFNAINTLFPLSDPEGDISMLLSQAQTLDGGGIDMLVPGGFINAGAAGSDTIAKRASQLGIFSAKTGDINIMVEGDLLVNSTRVFALQGDLLVWSSNGNIDAGKGAKTVASLPDPVTRIGPTGETIIEFPPAIEGSGLQGVNAFLFAPQGVINAGDAGIRATGDLTIGATAVIGADNIDVGGVSVGVPSAAAGVGAGIANAGDAANSATRDLAAETTSFGDEVEGGSTTLGILSVNVEGFGDCPAGDPLCKN